MAVKYHCDRCDATADPSAETTSGIRADGPTRTTGIAIPEGWRYATKRIFELGTLSPHAVEDTRVLLCKPCDTDLIRWFERTGHYKPETVPTVVEAPVGAPDKWTGGSRAS